LQHQIIQYPPDYPKITNFNHLQTGWVSFHTNFHHAFHVLNRAQLFLHANFNKAKKYSLNDLNSNIRVSSNKEIQITPEIDFCARINNIGMNDFDFSLNGASLRKRVENVSIVHNIEVDTA
jgi:hypothetical protein